MAGMLMAPKFMPKGMDEQPVKGDDKKRIVMKKKKGKPKGGKGK